MPFYGKDSLAESVRLEYGYQLAVSKDTIHPLVTLLRDFARPAVLVPIDEAEFQSLYIDGEPFISENSKPALIPSHEYFSSYFLSLIAAIG